METMRANLVTLVVALTLLFLDGASTDARRSVQERKQMLSLLQRLNKPPLATIQSPDGDIIDCVHISKQPAFDHPLLKNHTIQLRPSNHIGGCHESNIAPRPLTQTWHQNGMCPENTIPIRRTLEEDVLRASSVKSYGKKNPRSIPYLVSIADPDNNATKGHQYAIAFALGDSVYYGTKATFNLWQPTIERANDFSLTQLWITSGSYNNSDLNTIEAGWQIFPALYNDSSPRLFIFWTPDAYKTGCYNLQCPGFVQTNNVIAFGVTQLSVSIYGGTQYDIDISVWKDTKDGNWWLQVGSDIMGYWPSSLFSNLADSASSVEWGGEVESSPDASQTSTEMGSGHFPDEGFGKASYIKNITVLDSSYSLRAPSALGLQAEQPNCYNVKNGTNSDWGTSIFYGGPGKNPNCPK